MDVVSPATVQIHVGQQAVLLLAAASTAQACCQYPGEWHTRLKSNLGCLCSSSPDAFEQSQSTCPQPWQVHLNLSDFMACAAAVSWLLLCWVDRGSICAWLELAYNCCAELLCDDLEKNGCSAAAMIVGAQWLTGVLGFC
jgi:hypothetical protein